jgi:hypothetical protein
LVGVECVTSLFDQVSERIVGCHKIPGREATGVRTCVRRTLQNPGRKARTSRTEGRVYPRDKRVRYKRLEAGYNQSMTSWRTKGRAKVREPL